MPFWGKSAVMSAIKDCLLARGWKYREKDAETILTGVTGPSGRSYFIALRHEEAKRAVLILVNPLLADAERPLVAPSPTSLVTDQDKAQAAQVAAVCALLLDWNYSMVLGAYERDARDGEIRLRIAIPYVNTNVTKEQVCHCIDIAIVTLEVHLPQIEKVLQAPPPPPATAWKV